MVKKNGLSLLHPRCGGKQDRDFGLLQFFEKAGDGHLVLDE